MEGTESGVVDLAKAKRERPNWASGWRASTNPGRLLPDGTSKHAVSRNPAVLHGMRQSAARIAIDMERGTYIRKDGKAWTGPYSKWEIAEAIGYNSKHNQHLPKIFDEPYFSRYVEYERTVRDASYRMAMREAMPMLDPVISGFMIEALRRVLITPDKIPDNVLFTELRKFMQMKGEYEGAFSTPEDVKTLILNFNLQADKLPEEARSKALEIFKREMFALIGPQEQIIDALATAK